MPKKAKREHPRREQPEPDRSREAADDRFAKSETYERDGPERRPKEGTAADPMKQPTPSRLGTAAHALLDDPTGEEPSETEAALERAAGRKDG